MIDKFSIVIGFTERFPPTDDPAFDVVTSMWTAAKSDTVVSLFAVYDLVKIVTNLKPSGVLMLDYVKSRQLRKLTRSYVLLDKAIKIAEGVGSINTGPAHEMLTDLSGRINRLLRDEANNRLPKKEEEDAA